MGTPPEDDDHYFTSSPRSGSRPSTIEIVARGATIEVETDRGTFSPGRLDPGTRFLLDAAPAPPPTGRFLDLGCGYGPVALTLARLSPDADVVAVDVNERSRALTASNARRHGLANVTVSSPDEVGPDPFHLIWTNPPIRVGKRPLHELLSRWFSQLTPEGVAVMVVNRHLGADSLQRWLDANGHPTERLGSKKGYRLLMTRAAP